MALGPLTFETQNQGALPSNHEDRPKDRRLARRYPISCDLQYRISGWVLENFGSGKTINMSSSGLLLVTDRILSPGRRVQVLIDWPLKLDGRVGLRLVVFGAVVRVGIERVPQAAVRIERYEFRTISSIR
jgi:hypothetical protein